MKWFILAPILLAGCYPGFPDQSAAPEAYDRLITTKVDYATGDTLYLIRYSGVSYEDRGFGSRSRYQIDMHMAKSRDMGASSYIAQIALRYSPSEWPMDDTMSLVIDEHVYHIPLTPVNTRDVARFTGSGMDGDVSVTTTKHRLYALRHGYQKRSFSRSGPEARCC